MKKIAILVSILCIAFAAGAQPKFGIKSGKVNMAMNQMGQTISITMYFDDYGAKTASLITAAGQDIKSVSDGNKTYVINCADNTILQETENTEASQIDFTNLTDEVKGKYKIKEMGTEEFLGKTCQSYSAVVEQQGFEANVVYLIYKGIPLKTTTTIMGMSMVMEATSIEENIPIDQSLFAIPKK